MRRAYRSGFIVGLSAFLAVLAASHAAAQTSEYFICAQNKIFVFRNGGLVRSWNTVGSTSERGIFVLDTVRTLGGNAGSSGAEYSLNGIDQGPRYANPGNNWINDATTNGDFVYAWFYNDGVCFRFNLNYGAQTTMFTLGIGGGYRLGITYDPTDDSLWLSGENGAVENTMEHRTLSGTLLGSFNIGHDDNVALGLDPTDDTLWIQDHADYGSSVILEQWTKSGVRLQRLNLGNLGMQNTHSGGEFAFTAADCNSNGVDDADDIAGDTSEDCNGTSIPDECDVAASSSEDCNSNVVPDECETDCNGNAFPDDCDIAGPTSEDCNADNVPDECGVDCNTNGLADECDLGVGTSDDCDGDGIPDECQGLAGDVYWNGSDGGAFGDPDNWNPSGVVSGGSRAILSNGGPDDNRCIVGDAGQTGVCAVRVEASGSGRQVLQINAGSRLRANEGVEILAGGDVELRGGELAGGTVSNASNSIYGYGTIAADVVNVGLIRAALNDPLLFTGSSFDNQAGGWLYAPIATVVGVQSGSVSQAGEIEIRSNATVALDAPFTNAAGGLVTLLGGTLGAPSLANAAGADIFGTGVLDGDTANEGEITLIADTLVVGNLNNNGTVIIQSGILTVSGDLSGTGAIVGGFGGRGGDGGIDRDGGGLTLHGDFDLAADDAAQFDLTRATLRLAGGGVGPQRLEVIGPDRGAGAALPDAGLRSIGVLYLASSTPVQLVNRRCNVAAARREALYVDRLVFDVGATLDLAGQRLYYATSAPAVTQAGKSGVRIVDSVGGGGIYKIEAGGRL